MDELGYVYNRGAANLRRARSRTLASSRSSPTRPRASCGRPRSCAPCASTAPPASSCARPSTRTRAASSQLLHGLPDRAGEGRDDRRRRLLPHLLAGDAAELRPDLVVTVIWQFTNIWNDFLFGASFASGGGTPITVALNNIVNTSTGVKEYNVDMASAMLTALPKSGPRSSSWRRARSARPRSCSTGGAPT